MEQPQAKAKPEILIVGAGIGSMMIALLLEQIGIGYRVFERASEVKPLGSAMAFGANSLTVLEQLGIYEDFLKISNAFDNLYFFQGDCESLGTMDRTKNEELFGYRDLVFSRPDFYEILRKRVPSEKIFFKKKVLNIEEKEGKVFIHCADNTSYSGDILIGADGAYSGVRKSLYEQMDKKGLLPKEDLEEFSIGYTETVGIAKGNPEKFPILKEELSNFSQILYEGNSNCFIITLPNNQISWGLGTQVSRSDLNEMQSRSSEWRADASESMLNQFREFPSPIGGTMGDIFDATPKDLISTVYLEEKLFKTWSYGRTVLLGDACHKLHPAGAQGGANAIHDAVVLANCLYAMKDTSEKSIHAAFDDYYNQRFSYAEAAYNNSSGMSKILNGQKFVEKMIRKVFLNYVPGWVIDAATAKAMKYRPQVAWLPLAPHRGKKEILPQKFGVVKPLDAEHI